jgi:hypothetical protein
MTVATSISEQAGESLGSFLPQLAGALALLLVDCWWPVCLGDSCAGH